MRVGADRIYLLLLEQDVTGFGIVDGHWTVVLRDGRKVEGTLAAVVRESARLLQVRRSSRKRSRMR